MKPFLDTADLVEIERWLKTGLLDGITTNPTILKSAGVTEPMKAWRQIVELIRKHTATSISLSVEVFSDSPEEMLKQAKAFVAELDYEGTTIKIPILGTDGTDRLAVIHELAKQEIAVNCTACITWLQAFAAAKAGAKYVSLLYRRIMGTGLDAEVEIRKTRQLLDQYKLPSEIIVGSIRKKYDVLKAYEAGAHIVTIPTKFLPELLMNRKSVETQKQFLKDAGVLNQ
mgnify:CR=1 FL=1